MLVLLLCIIMKIAEFSVGRTSPPPLTMSARPPPTACNRRCRRCKHYASSSPRQKHHRQFCSDKCISRKCKPSSRRVIRVTTSRSRARVVRFAVNLSREVGRIPGNADVPAHVTQFPTFNTENSIGWTVNHKCFPPPKAEARRMFSNFTSLVRL